MTYQTFKQNRRLQHARVALIYIIGIMLVYVNAEAQTPKKHNVSHKTVSHFNDTSKNKWVYTEQSKWHIISDTTRYAKLPLTEYKRLLQALKVYGGQFTQAEFMRWQIELPYILKKVDTGRVVNP